jgi:hypothetical protein
LERLLCRVIRFRYDSGQQRPDPHAGEISVLVLMPIEIDVEQGDFER